MAAEIETLRAKKETIKEELQTEGQKEKSLQEDIVILEEKIEIRGLEKELETKRESVKQLESRKNELQGQWNQSTQDIKKDEEPKEPSEPAIIAMTIQTPEHVESQESDAQKKRRWF